VARGLLRCLTKQGSGIRKQGSGIGIVKHWKGWRWAEEGGRREGEAQQVASPHILPASRGCPAPPACRCAVTRIAGRLPLSSSLLPPSPSSRCSKLCREAFRAPLHRDEAASSLPSCKPTTPSCPCNYQPPHRSPAPTLVHFYQSAAALQVRQQQQGTEGAGKREIVWRRWVGGEGRPRLAAGSKKPTGKAQATAALRAPVTP